MTEKQELEQALIEAKRKLDESQAALDLAHELYKKWVESSNPFKDFGINLRAFNDAQNALTEYLLKQHVSTQD